jgi:hypothetical protein
VGFGLVGLAGTMLLLSLGVALLAGGRGVRLKQWTGWDRWRGLAVVSLLQLLQPLARSVGRVQGRWALRKSALDFPDTDLLEGDLIKREVWLRRLLAHMKSCGWMVQPCNEWDEADIEVLGPGPYSLKLCSVYEEDLQRALHQVRYRVTAKLKPHAPVLVGGMMAILIGMTQALYLAPLALPIIFVLRHYVRARRTMIKAVSQMAMDCGWPVGMPKAKMYY